MHESESHLAVAPDAMTQLLRIILGRARDALSLNASTIEGYSNGRISVGDIDEAANALAMTDDVLMEIEAYDLLSRKAHRGAAAPSVSDQHQPGQGGS